MSEDTSAQSTSGTNPNLGRNEPCHCGSGKKFKRCHGIDAAPKLSAPKAPAWGQQATDAAGSLGNAPGMPGGGAAGPMGGFDPSKMDPQMMQQFARMLQRLPKGQLQRLQSIMQRAMSGKDVTQEAAEFERTLPPDLQQLMISFAGQMGQTNGMAGGMPGADAAALSDASALSAPSSGAGGEMSEEEARKIVEAAAAEGKISADEAQKLLDQPEGAQSGEKKGLGKLWRGLTGKSGS
jgi:hypothetical protein